MSSDLEAKFNQLIIAGTGLLVALVPLIISTKTSSIFALPKFILLLSGTVIITLFWLIKLLFSAELKIKLGVLELAAIILFILISLSFILSINYSTSLFGDYTRFEGFFTYLAYVSLFIVAGQLAWNNQRIIYLAYFLVTGASIVSAIGILQYFGYNIISVNAHFNIHRSSGMFGNPSLLAGYLVLVFPVSLALFFRARDSIITALLGLASLLIFIATMTSFTRGGWLAILLTTLIFFIWSRKNWFQKKAKIIAVIFTMLSTILLLLVYTSTASSEINLVDRIKSATQPSSGSLGTRWEIWRGSLELIKERPLLGSGPDTFALVFPRHKSAKLTASQSYHELNDNAHNYLLQIAVTLGIPALLIFIFIFVRSLSISGKGLDEESSLIYRGLLVGVLGYLITVSFEVAIIGATFIIWIIFGIAASFSERNDYKFPINLSVGVRQTSVVSVTIVSVILIIFISRIYVADTYFKSGKIFLAAGNYNASVTSYEHAISVNSNFNEYYQGVAGVFTSKRENLNSSAEIQQEMEAFKAGIENNPYRLENYLGLAKADIFAALQFKDERYFSEADDLIGQALKKSPTSAPAYYNRGTLNYYKANYNQAISDFKKTSNLKSSYAPAYYGLGLAYKKIGQNNKAIKAFEKTVQLDENFNEAKNALRELRK